MPCCTLNQLLPGSESDHLYPDTDHSLAERGETDSEGGNRDSKRRRGSIKMSSVSTTRSSKFAPDKYEADAGSVKSSSRSVKTYHDASARPHARPLSPRSSGASLPDTRCERNPSARKSEAEERDAPFPTDVLSVSTMSSHREAEPSPSPDVPALVNASSASASVQSSQYSKIPVNTMAYWSSLSVRAAIAVIEANGTEKVAKVVSNTVLNAGKRKRPVSTSSLRALATEVSMKVLKAGGDHSVAAATVVTIMGSEHEQDSGDAYAPKIPRQRGGKTSSTPPLSPSSKGSRKQLKDEEREQDIKERTEALEIAERMNLEREQEIKQRMEALDAATAEVMEKVNYIQHQIEEKVLTKKEKEESSGGSDPSTAFNMKCYWCGGL